MLHFSDRPHRRYHPRLNPLVLSLVQTANRHFILPGAKHRITSLSVTGEERLSPIRKDPTARLVFLPNHPTHSDAQTMTETQRRLKLPSCFMAAHDVFERGRFRAWMMQHCGVFSIDREGNDKEALKIAHGIIVDGRYGLTIFPEGNVYLMNDRVTPFLEGAAYIALRAQKQLGEKATVWLAPVSIKASHLSDQRAHVRSMIDRFASEVGAECDVKADLADEIKRIGIHAMGRNLRQRGYFPPEGDHRKNVPGLLQDAAGRIISRLEAKMELKAQGEKASLRDRVRRVRSAIHRVRIDPGRAADHHVAVTWADEAILALRLLSYAGDYLDERRTLDRFAETAEKLLEDLYSKPTPPLGNRHVFVRINPTINAREALERGGARMRTSVELLTRKLEDAVQSGLDEINRSNQNVGGELF